MQTTLKKVEILKKELDNLPPIQPNDERRLWEKFRLEWNYNSNHIEGNTLTYGETKLLLIKGETTGNHSVREYDEMRAHDVAVEMVREWAKPNARSLTESDIRELNKIILVRSFWKDAKTSQGQKSRKKITPGQYKEHPNHVIEPTGEKFYYTEPDEVPIKMEELLNWYQNEIEEIHPVIVAAIFHYRLVRIHPFDDGNGRVCRLLMNYHLLKNGFPPIIIQSADKKNYLAALKRADADDIEFFIQYIAEQLLSSLELAIAARKGESIEEEDDWQKRIKILQKQTKQNDSKVVKLTNETLLDLYENSFNPLFNHLEEKLSTLNALFAQHQHQKRFSSRESVQGRQSNETFDDLMQRLFETEKLTALNSISYAFSWDALKNGTTELSGIGFSVTVDFREKYKYKISTGYTNVPTIEKFYSEQLSEKEIKDFVNQLGKVLTERVEEKFKS